MSTEPKERKTPARGEAARTGPVRADALKVESAKHEAAMKYAAAFLSTEAGRWVLGDILAKFPIDRTSFDFAKPEPLLAALKDGQRSVSMDIESAVRLGAKLAGIHYERP